MGWLALILAAIGAAFVAMPGAGMYLAMGLGIFAIGLGHAGYQRRSSPGPARLAGSAGMAVGFVAFALGCSKYGLTLAAISRLESLFAG